VVTGTVTEDSPPGIVAVAGTDAAELLDERVTVIPLAGAVPLRVKVPVAVVPPGTKVGAIEKDASPPGETVILQVTETPL
jgi:hypothetical protein